MIDEAVDLLNRIGDLGNADAQRDILFFLGGRVGTMAEGFLRASVPPEPNGRPLELFYTRTNAKGQSFQSKFKSLKQQRKVIMLGKKGKIPFSRTGFLPNSYTHAVSIVDTGVIVQVGTNSQDAEYTVGDPDVQNHYHAKTGWEPVSETVGAHTADYQQEIVTSGKPWLVGYLKGQG